MPMIAFSGVRISWLMAARNRPLALPAASASSLAWARAALARARSSISPASSLLVASNSSALASISSNMWPRRTTADCTAASSRSLAGGRSTALRVRCTASMAFAARISGLAMSRRAKKLTAISSSPKAARATTPSTLAQEAVSWMRPSMREALNVVRDDCSSMSRSSRAWVLRHVASVIDSSARMSDLRLKALWRRSASASSWGGRTRGDVADSPGMCCSSSNDARSARAAPSCDSETTPGRRLLIS